jgi:probable rRNA maturation factor
MSLTQVDILASSRYPVNRDRIRDMVRMVVVREQLTSDLIVSVLIVGKRKMREINRDFHGEDYATDVLSFPYTDPQSSRDAGIFAVPPKSVTILGDLVVCFPVAMERATEKQHLVDDEIDNLVEHGMMHLVGKHHQ